MAWLAETLLDSAPDHDHGPELRPGVRVGRFLVEDRLGAGGMGVVFAAVDPVLGRKVALKLLHPSRDASPTGLARLVREAQAMAQVSHPNVVTVHDVGQHDGGVFIAMELVAGETLGAWLRRGARGWRDVLGMLRQAGEGLLAVHERGLVHRDIKPDNVMVGDDGRVRLMDFGLVRAQRGVDTDESDEVQGTDVLHRSLTQGGAVMGTPMYMAPEQIRGREVDAAADQFSWCATAYEALFGVRAFAGGSLPEIDEAIERGEVHAPRTSEVPAWIHRVLVRGLAADPAKRWPSVRDLLDALAVDPRPRRRLGFAAMAVGVLALAAWGGTEVRSHFRVAVCEDEADTITETWNHAAKTRVNAAFLATKQRHAPSTFARVDTMLDEWTDEWAQTRRDQCHVAEPERTLAQECLDELVPSLEELIVAFEAATPSSIASAHKAAADLPLVASCTELDRLPTSSARDRVVAAALRRAIARSKSATYADELDDARAQAVVAIVLGDALQQPVLAARGRVALGRMHYAAGDLAEAASLYERALEMASEAGADEVVFLAAQHLIPLASQVLERPRDGVRWSRVALASLDRLGAGPEDPRRAGVRNATALLHEAMGDWDLARAELRAAAETLEGSLGSDHIELASTLHNLAVVERMAGELDVAEPLFARSLALHVEIAGPDHPDVATVSVPYADLLASRGRKQEAEELLRRALASIEGLNPESAQLVNVLFSLGHVLGPTEEAFAILERARDISIRAFGARHRATAAVAGEVGFLSLARKDYARAREEYGFAADAIAESHGNEHPTAAQLRYKLAIANRALGRIDEARTAVDLAAPVIAKQFGKHRLTGDVWLLAGELRIAEGEHAAAIEPLELALAAYEGTDGPQATARERLREARAAAKR